MKPREWQDVALTKFRHHEDKFFLLNATPGAGKTVFSAFCAKEKLDAGHAHFCIVVVPTTALKGDAVAGFLGDWNKVGVQLQPHLREATSVPRGCHGAVITYQNLPTIINTVEVWARSGIRLFTTLDEIHHATETNVWGSCAERLAMCSSSVLGMTGTAFRGDGRKISFVRYGENGKAIADHSYSYKTAITDEVCRPVQFITDDGMADYIRDDEEHSVRLSEANDENVSDVARTVFNGDSEWLEAVIEKADATLEDYRTWDADAGGLVVCRPGFDEEGDDKHVRLIAGLVRKVTGEMPEIITHEDGDEANAKIERFRAGRSKWICSVRKISEGVDIKRLRVEVMANRPTTELLFRQLVGRVVRVDDEKRPGDATVFIAKFPELTEWAARIREEAEAGIKALNEKQREASERDEQPLSSFFAQGSTHEDGGAISDFGEHYSSAEINAAERLKRGDSQLDAFPVTGIAHLLRKVGVQPDPEQAPADPIYIQKQRVRTQLSKAARQLAIRRNPTQPDFQAVFQELKRQVGCKNLNDLTDNYSIDIMRQALSMVHKWLGDGR